MKALTVRAAAQITDGKPFPALRPGGPGFSPFVLFVSLCALAGIAFPVAWWVVGRRTGEG